jgi:tetratricopeptide (TPR) repeat protein
MAKEMQHAPIDQGSVASEIHSMAVDKSMRAVPGLERSRTLDPLNLLVSVNLAGAYSRSGRPAEALAELDRGLAISPNGLHAAHVVLLACSTGDKDQQELAWQRLATIDSSELTQQLFELRHRPGEVRQLLRDRMEAGSKSPSDAQWAACFEDHELALRLLQANIHPEMRLLSAMSSWHPLLAQARRLPGFKDFVRELGLVEYWREFGWGDHCQPLGDTDFECR